MVGRALSVKDRILCWIKQIHLPAKPRPLYDDGTDLVAKSPNQRKSRIILVIMGVYGFIGGFFTQQYADYFVLRFTASVYHKVLSQNVRLISSPVTILACTVIVICMCIAFLLLGWLLYALMRRFGQKISRGDETCQLGAALSILCALVVGILLSMSGWSMLIPN